MKPRILLLNPPIYDFTAYDFWLKPYGMLKAAGALRDAADLTVFDYLCFDRDEYKDKSIKRDKWNRGPFPQVRITKPDAFKGIKRYYRRFGRPRQVFRDFLYNNKPFDAVFVQTVMTYWYQGYKEVIEDIRQYCPGARIFLGGFYASVCPDHAMSLGPDGLVIEDDMSVIYKNMGIEPDDGHYETPFWQGYTSLKTGVMTLTKGCPFKCTYCSIAQRNLNFSTRSLGNVIADYLELRELGVENIALYDDALLYKPEITLVPFLEYLIENNNTINLHTPNALHGRFITPEIADLMVRAGFKTFYLGFESSSDDFQSATGSKVVSHELAQAVENLLLAGADRKNITAYEILGHPKSSIQHLEQSIRFASSLGIKVMLSDFSPIPGTPDGDLCSRWVDLDEPLNHNKSAFPIRLLGDEKVNYFKQLCKDLNRQVK